jgi:hypothetical protein
VFTSKSGSRLAAYDQLTNDDSICTPTIYGLNGASPDGRWLSVFPSYTARLDIHRLPGFEHVASLTNEAPIFRFEYSPRGDEVAVACRQGIEFWSTRTWQRTRRLPNFTDIHYTADTRTFWLSTGLRTGGLHDARTAEPILSLPPGTLPLALSPDARHLAVSVDSRRVQLWDLVQLRDRLRELGLDWTPNE